MDSTEEEFSSFTTKGRRTKRHRSILAVSASASSSYRGGSDGGFAVGKVGSSDTSYGYSSSSASPSDEQHDVMSEVTTEEEDMANFLILLSQGIQKKKKSNNIGNNGNIGMLYECKTCNKTFPSFQALGGHRTSHKKIKQAPPSVSIIPSPDHIDEHRDVVVDDVVDGHKEMSMGDVKKIVDNNNNNKARVHECSICGSEFPSGQALGGHMRRHRAAAPTPTPGRPIIDDSVAASTTVIDTGGPRNILSLDLNLPAPDDGQQVDDEDDHMETKFVHVLPRPAPLVDCHY